MAISDGKYMALTTFRKDGTPVASPVWVVDKGDGKVAFYTSSTSGKVKRLANNSKVIVQPSNFRGQPVEGSAPTEGTAEVVTGAELEVIREKIVAKYGMMTRITRFLAKVGGWIKRKPQPYADRGVIVTLTS